MASWKRIFTLAATKAVRETLKSGDRFAVKEYFLTERDAVVIANLEMKMSHERIFSFARAVVVSREKRGFIARPALRYGGICDSDRIWTDEH